MCFLLLLSVTHNLKAKYNKHTLLGIAQQSDPNVLRGERTVRPVAVQVVTGAAVGSQVRHHQVPKDVCVWV